MAFNKPAVIARLRTLVAEVTGFNRVYSQGTNDANMMPVGTLEIPCAIVFAGQTPQYHLGQATHSRTYEVHADLLLGGADIGDRAYEALVLVDRVIEKLAVNLKLGGLATLCVLERSSGLITIEWARLEYTGERMTFRVTEHASAAPAPGS